jgi:hypothetical protein
MENRELRDTIRQGRDSCGAGGANQSLPLANRRAAPSWFASDMEIAADPGRKQSCHNSHLSEVRPFSRRALKQDI